MTLYCPNSNIALEVIPEPEHIDAPDLGPEVPIIYVGKDQVGNPAYIEALSTLILGLENETGDKARNECGEGADGPGSSEQGHSEQAYKGFEDRRPGNLTDATAEEFLELLEAQDELAETLVEQGVPTPLVSSSFDEDDSFDVLQSWLAELSLAQAVGQKHVNIGHVGSLNIYA